MACAAPRWQNQRGDRGVEKAQKQDPKIPHTWSAWASLQKEPDYDRGHPGIRADGRSWFRARPCPTTISDTSIKLARKPDLTPEEDFETSATHPNLAGPHFQLYNTYRQAGRTADANRS